MHVTVLSVDKFHTRGQQEERTQENFLFSFAIHLSCIHSSDAVSLTRRNIQPISQKKTKKRASSFLKPQLVRVTLRKYLPSLAKACGANHRVRCVPRP